VPVVVYIPLSNKENNSNDGEKTFNSCIQRPNTGMIVKSRNKSPIKKIKKIGHLKHNEKRKSNELRKSRDSDNKASYYQTAFISNPCEQLFGPKNNDLSTSKTTEAAETKPDEYIPAPKWSKSEILLLEELYRKGRYPKSCEIKMIAQQLKVMDTDVEEWFRKRRGRDRKTRRKNDNLKSMIDNYLDH
jgi:hypothetical protein